MFVPGPIGQVATGFVTRQIRTARQGIFKRNLELQAKLPHSVMKLRGLAALKIAQVIQANSVKNRCFGPKMLNLFFWAHFMAKILGDFQFRVGASPFPIRVFRQNDLPLRVYGGWGGTPLAGKIR